MFASRLTGCLLLLTAFGCQNESDSLLPAGAPSSTRQQSALTAPASNVRLKQMVASGNNGGLGLFFTTTYFTYSQGRNLQKVTVPVPSVGVSEQRYEYTYDQQGRVSAFRMMSGKADDAGTIGQQNTFSFGNGTMERFYSRVQTNGQLLPYDREPNFREIYRLNEQGLITELIQEGIIRYGVETRQRFLYTYENGNVVKVAMRNETDQEEFTITYEYDDKVNPFYKWMYQPDPVLYGSRNNIVGARVNSNQPQWKTYTYNEQGLPLTQTYVSTGAVLTYEYETY